MLTMLTMLTLLTMLTMLTMSMLSRCTRFFGTRFEVSCTPLLRHSGTHTVVYLVVACLLLNVVILKLMMAIINYHFELPESFKIK